MIPCLALFLSLAAAAPWLGGSKAVRETSSSQPTTLLISGSTYIIPATFDGTTITLKDNVSLTGAAPSWLIEGKGKRGFFANDENSATLYHYSFFGSSATQASETATYQGSTGVVHLAYNDNRTLLFGAGYGSQAIDVWDASATDGTVKLLASIPTNDTASRPHQTVVSPDGTFAVVNDLGLDRLHVLNTADDANVFVAGAFDVPAGCGPRHGAFYAANDTAPTRYLVACEMSHELLVLNVSSASSSAGEFAVLSGPIQTLQTSSSSSSSLTAAELLLVRNADRSADVYVSNRRTGGANDTVAHFRLSASAGDNGNLTAVGETSTGGVGPRGMSVSADGAYLFVGNQASGTLALAVLGRDADSGELGASPVAGLAWESVVGDLGDDYGPQFVVEWQE